MERTLSDYEKIKKAEEIYNRRRMQNVGGVRVSNPSVERERLSRRELSSVKKMVLQICICVVLYFIVYLVQNSNYIFSEQFMEKARELLNYDINFSEQIDNIKNYFEKNFQGFAVPVTQEEKGQSEQEQVEHEQSEQEQSTTQKEEVQEAAQLGAVSDIEEVPAVGGSEVEAVSEIVEEKSQMQLDAEYISNNYALGLPLRGEITSPYGERTVAPKFHVGVDIGANTGTAILAAEDGIATLVSTTGDYGNHIKITSGDLVTLYAHCSTLNVTEGQSISKGEKIAEVGQTGNVTGPHLHFEVIFQGRYVDPQMLLDFE